ncbi:uncharacterized protein TNCT_407351 [Trichonephila clavata]|uniref:Ankyrin repeat protein n=1 Tax=Trichonephila clavata TaxID=2740835 RepID=A0A8X6KHN8_TRICU|nr:uncharacterized protein TNCT_534971 [Trichonephila clavata]GFQ73456.1 uncharacterized protein TNCT_407351 [Trichonephila clavata]
MFFKNTGSFDINNNQALNQALGYAVKSLDYDVMELLINAGANVNAIGINSIGSVIYKYERALAHEKRVMHYDLKDYKEKCCFILGELVINGAMPRNVEEKEKILNIFKEREGFDEFKEVVKLKLEANSVGNMIPPKKPPRTFEYKPITMYAEVSNNVVPPKKPPRTFEYKSKSTGLDTSLLKEPIYAEVYDTKISNSLGELSVSEESIYAEIYDSHKKSTENSSLNDSGYLSISEEPIYETIDNFSEQKKPASLKQKEPEQSSEPIYARVDLSKKRAERKAKGVKANSGTYHGLVQDKVNDWQVKLNEQSANKSISQQQTNDQKIKTKAGFSVEEIRQKYERRDSGYDSGYDSDTKVEQQLELAPKSEIGSVSIEHGVIGSCRYKITDISL